MSWYRAKALDTLVKELNSRAPKRSKRSDGWVGDTSHQARKSDHNPDYRRGGVVRAQDVTHDPTGGLDGYWLSRAVAALLGKHPALGSGAYIIYDWRIISTDRLREGWREYYGTNGHTKHVHISVGTSGYDSTRKWGLGEGVVTRAVRKVSGKYPVYLSVVRGQAKSKRPKVRGSVRRLQKLLVRFSGESLSCDGIWGDKTTAAYRRWQKKKKKKGFRITGVPKSGSLRALVKLDKNYIYLP